MLSSVAEQVSLRLGRAPVMRKPYPWIYVRDVFPAVFYREMLANLPTDRGYRPTDYPSREFCTPELFDLPFWRDLAQWMVTGLADVLTRKFAPEIRERFGARELELVPDMRLVRDREGYEITPHTDHPNKIVSLLFYLPPDDSQREHGTRVYVPHDKTFTCDGMSRWTFEGFHEAWRAPFVPNSCWGFVKTPKAFHGVPAIGHPIQRDVMLFNLYEKRPDAKDAAA